MGKRLTRIYTRTGDNGTTGMADGTRISKDDVLMHAQGDIDELNSILGLLLCSLDDAYDRDVIQTIQNDLFDLGAGISSSIEMIDPVKIHWLETRLDEINSTLPALSEFILPGGNEQAALCHLARSVCRRAERNIVALNRKKTIPPVILVYINRLSDLLFVLARSLARRDGNEEIYWMSRRMQDDHSDEQ